jgi:hypothetical protein
METTTTTTLFLAFFARSGTLKQGDQIGRIFAHWAIVSFGQFFENYKNPNFKTTGIVE